MPIEGARAELSYARPRVGGSGVCVEDLTILSLRPAIQSVYGSSEFEVFVHSGRVENGIETVALIT